MDKKKKKIKSTIIQIKLSLHPEEDADLIGFFNSIPAYKRAKQVKSIIRGVRLSYVGEEDESTDKLTNER